MKKFCVERSLESNFVWFSDCNDIFPPVDFDYEDFEALTGLKLKPGEIVQCEIKVIKKG